MTLSADILNQRSPYKLSQLGEFTFRFVTDQNIHYTVGFYKDTIFMVSTNMVRMIPRFLMW